ncbi:hypothetical protein F444_16502 [Phytophthora nicotianae P1976]|uniref:Uncharacterized protein n=1 Tax=Phytophthora nicotianae P1976 TaxID=1317066 RepID=A0A080ZI00_PHYNI|nr:hypothetical protein F444_16502 [Phytophthora nicotianae P1976]
MKTHLSNCDAVPTPLGRLTIDETLEFEEEERRTSGTQTLITQLNAKVYPRLSREEREAPNLKFAAAMHKTEAGLSTFEHPAWQTFILSS